MATLTELLTTRIPPHEQEAERAILGAILWAQPGALEKAQRRLEADDFYLEAHRQMWEAMERVSARGQALDVVMLGAELRAAGHAELAGGTLAVLIEETLLAVFVDEYIRLIRTARALAEIMRIGMPQGGTP